MLKSANGVQMFGDVARRKRYFYALLMILLMIGIWYCWLLCCFM